MKKLTGKKALNTNAVAFIIILLIIATGVFKVGERTGGITGTGTGGTNNVYSHSLDISGFSATETRVKSRIVILCNKIQ